ncbi:vitamin-D-receptor interacting mediator subunit 4-domain-containing protein [Podospora appendiculata]|uniref:Mediator of RNA polymerase II transcription subunit 4 n=1 Tax=Podospora appendiculata TaxID=314037 RepID=A0AAE0X8K3_9PEZI|nr:vitamin-D-receptor interacting mediator subunit 4-domain-containing protein [Podospora appendiculata]
MDKYLDERFERVEKALSNLIDSIAKYNPSPQLAEDLVAADEELAAGLKELERHQNNYARIQQLRQETAALDAQTKDIIGALWTMRKEVKNTPTTTYPSTGPRYNFAAHELLDYARRISRNTLPPPGVTNGVDMTATTTTTPQPNAQDPSSPDNLRSQTQTPNASFSGAVGTPAEQAPLASQATTAASNISLPDHLKPMVNLLTGAVFHPWPTEDKIRSGALASYQMLIDRGIDPKGYDPEEEEERKRAEEQARKEADEKARADREEAERRAREDRERMARERESARQEAERRGSVMGGIGSQAPKSQFTFLDGLDDDDDDED